jgi:hypothetical protein
MKALRLLPLLTLLALSSCDQVDYLDVQPSAVVLRHKNDGKWLSAKAMSHTRVHYPNERVSWSVKDPTVAAVDEKGRITPLKSGITEVVARHNKITASVPVEVRFAEKMTVSPEKLSLNEGGPSTELVVKVFDFQGRELKDRNPTFAAKDKEVVSMGQNAAFPVNAGQTEVLVRVEELEQRVSVTVAAEKRAKVR